MKYGVHIGACAFRHLRGPLDPNNTLRSARLSPVRHWRRKERDGTVVTARGRMHEAVVSTSPRLNPSYAGLAS